MPLTRPNQGHLCPKIILGIQFEIDLGFVSDIANWQLSGPRYVKNSTPGIPHARKGKMGKYLNTYVPLYYIH